MKIQDYPLLSQATAAATARAREISHDATLRERLRETARYLTRTEVHTYAFSVAANAILAFFPFLLLMFSITKRTLHSPTMTAVLGQLLRDYLPAGQDFIVRNLDKMTSAKGGVKAFSMFMLLFTSSGVFLPLEVALNQVWGIKKNRSYLMNQVVSTALAFGCGVLAMLSIAATAGNRYLLQFVLRNPQNFVFRGMTYMVMKSFAVVASILIFFVIFWLLPNGKVPLRAVFTSALVTGLLWESAKYVYILSLPFLNFQEAYGPFTISVTLIFWAFISGLLLLGGAHLSASGKARLRP